MFFGVAQQSANIVFDVPDGIGTSAFRSEMGFKQSVQLWQWPVELIGRALRRIGILEDSGERLYGRFQILLQRWREMRLNLFVKVRQHHGFSPVPKKSVLSETFKMSIGRFSTFVYK